MFNVRPNAKKKEVADSDDPSALYGDEELDRIMASLPDRAFKGPKGKGKKKVEREP